MTCVLPAGACAAILMLFRYPGLTSDKAMLWWVKGQHVSPVFNNDKTRMPEQADDFAICPDGAEAFLLTNLVQWSAMQIRSE